MNEEMGKPSRLWLIKCTRTQLILFKLDFFKNKALYEKILFYIFD